MNYITTYNELQIDCKKNHWHTKYVYIDVNYVINRTNELSQKFHSVNVQLKWSNR